MIAVAAVFGLLAVFVAQSWLNSAAEARLRSIDSNKPSPIAANTVVVAARPLRFGHELTAEALREAPWPDGALPQGAFTRVSEVLSRGKRVVLTAIEANEPVLAMKITGPGQRATLSALVGPGMKAVTIRVNDVDGVGGFVLPGDRVDIVLTRQEKETASTQVLLQDVRVLAVDQVADERASNPAVPKTVTVEVDTVAGQKLGLAASIGTLSLLLRKAGETASSDAKRVTLRDLFNELTADTERTATTVAVTRGMSKRENYRVPLEPNEQTQAQAQAAAPGPAAATSATATAR
jgi:pilus assembly protein CpaB